MPNITIANPLYRPLLILVLVSGALGLIGTAQARPDMSGTDLLDSRYQAMDTDGDGKVSREEFYSALPQMRETAFEAMDTDGDGWLSLEEWRAAMFGHMTGAEPSGKHPNHAGPGKPAGPDLLMPPVSNP